MIQGPESWDIAVIRERQGLTAEDDCFFYMTGCIEGIPAGHHPRLWHIVRQGLNYTIVSFHIQAQKFEYPHNSLDVLVCKKGDKFVFWWVQGTKLSWSSDKLSWITLSWTKFEFKVKLNVELKSPNWTICQFRGQFKQWKPSSNWWPLEASSGKKERTWWVPVSQSFCDSLWLECRCDS
jgi:hypothetical protein